MPAHKSSIFDLLNKDNLAIPDYQRPHKWTKRNIEELIAAEWMYHSYHFEMYQS